MVAEDSPVIIIGAGAWGLSTALHLLRAGHTNITVFDRASRLPSPYSAARDLNKIVRAEYEDPFYTQLTLSAIEAWKSPLFGPYFPQSGRLGLKEDFRDCAWQFSGPLHGFKRYFNRLAGYAHLSNALKGIWEYCASIGVKFMLGEEIEKAVKLTYSGKKCTGVQAAHGKQHSADLVICASGAHAASPVPVVEKFVTARSWSVTHIQLTEDETNLLRGIPTTDVRDLGSFFEPDPKTRLFKLCPLEIGYTSTNAKGISLPPSDRLPPPQDFISYADEQRLRQLLREIFPWMADSSFVEQKLCWFADTADSGYCIDYVSGTDNQGVVLSENLGHGFKMMPIFGSWVVKLLNDGQQALPGWQWKNTDLTGQD